MSNSLEYKTDRALEIARRIGETQKSISREARRLKYWLIGGCIFVLGGIAVVNHFLIQYFLR